MKRFSTVILGFALASATFAANVTVFQGTEVKLRFLSPVHSMKNKVGDIVRFAVAEDVKIKSRRVIRKGTRVEGKITKIKGHGKFGVNAQVEITLGKVRAMDGQRLPLEPKNAGKRFGSRTDGAAAASAGGLIILGPVGLLGGALVDGKKVDIKVGHQLLSEVGKDCIVRVR